MGFRTVAITQDVKVDWPDWLFSDRRMYGWRAGDHDSMGTSWVLYTPWERKFYDMESFEAIREALIQVGWFDRGFELPYRIVLMHEDDTVEQVSIHEDRVERHWMERFSDKPKVAPLASGQAVKRFEVEE